MFNLRHSAFVNAASRIAYSPFVLTTLPLFIFSAVSPADDSAAPDVLEFNIVYTGDMWRNQRGGIKKGSTYLDNVDVTLDVPGIRDNDHFFGYIVANNSQQFSEDLVGDAQVVSNIDTNSGVRIFELWYEREFALGSLRTGLYDVNSEFDAIETSGLFLNSLHGIGADFSQSGVRGPSIFPLSSFGIRWAKNLGEHWATRAVILDATPGDEELPHRNTVHINKNEGGLGVAEIEYHTNENRVVIGAWRYTQDFSDLRGDEFPQHASQGFYGFIDKKISDMLGYGELRGWLRNGYAADRVNPLSHYLGGGLVWKGFCPKVPEQAIGIAIARASQGVVARELARQESFTADASHETVLEFTYRIPIGERLVIQPDSQWIQHAGFAHEHKTTWVTGVRFEMTFWP